MFENLKKIILSIGYAYPLTGQQSAIPLSKHTDTDAYAFYIGNEEFPRGWYKCTLEANKKWGSYRTKGITLYQELWS